LNEEIQIGEFGVSGEGNDITILTYGNGYYFSKQAEKILKEKYQVKCKLIDLRWIAPLNKQALIEEIKHDKRILIVDECRKTGSFSEALVTMIVENISERPQIKVVAAHDCFITLGVAAAAGLPSKNEIIESCLQMLGRSL
jgi:2-oxoisovalerate dehydrogenase E1 component